MKQIFEVHVNYFHVAHEQHPSTLEYSDCIPHNLGATNIYEPYQSQLSFSQEVQPRVPVPPENLIPASDNIYLMELMMTLSLIFLLSVLPFMYALQNMHLIKRNKCRLSLMTQLLII